MCLLRHLTVTAEERELQNSDFKCCVESTQHSHMPGERPMEPRCFDDCEAVQERLLQAGTRLTST